MAARMRSLGRVVKAQTLGRLIQSGDVMGDPASSPARLLLIANARIPTLQLSFLKPLRALVESGQLALELISEEQLKERFGRQPRSRQAEAWLRRRLKAFAPTAVIFCRYSGPHAELVVAAARATRTPVIFHLDDDLLNVPKEIGLKKWQFHNQPRRLATVRYLLDHADVVYCSTPGLRDRLAALLADGGERLLPGRIYCSAEVIKPVERRGVRRLGYMGFDHEQDFELALPAVVRILQDNEQLSFELFGSIPRPALLEPFGERVKVHGPVRDYEKFLQKLAGLNWDIGICPLADTRFNAVKANTKWVEYTAVGAAVIASRGTIYEHCCANDCGLLAGKQDEWVAAFQSLIDAPEKRVTLVKNAQARLSDEYSVEALRRQVLDVIEVARKRALGASATRGRTC